MKKQVWGKKYKRRLVLHSDNYENALEEGKKKARNYGIYPLKWRSNTGTFHYNSNDAWMELD